MRGPGQVARLAAAGVALAACGRGDERPAHDRRAASAPAAADASIADAPPSPEEERVAAAVHDPGMHVFRVRLGFERLQWAMWQHAPEAMLFDYEGGTQPMIEHAIRARRPIAIPASTRLSVTLGRVDDGAVAWANAHRVAINLDCTQPLPSRAIRHLACTAADDASLARVAELTDLESLDLGHSDVTNAGMIHLTRLARLAALSLGSTVVSSAGLRQIAKLTSLRALRLSFVHMSDAGLAAISRLRELESLDLTGNTFSNAGLAHVAKLTRLRVLDVEFVDHLGDAGLAHIVKLRALEVLNLGSTAITPRGLARLAALPALRGLNLRGTMIDDRTCAQFNFARGGPVCER